MSSTTADIVWSAAPPRTRAVAYRMLGSILGTLLIAAGAHARFYLPGNPVPGTLQTFFVLLAGGLLGPVAGAAAVVNYLLLGWAGAPFFAVGGWAGPTAGYLAGFPAAALLVGFLLRRQRSPARCFAAAYAGTALILAAGWTHLAFLYGLGAGRAWTLGVFPFLAGDAVKTALVALLCIRNADPKN